MSIGISDSRRNSGTELKLLSPSTLEAHSTKPVIPETFVCSCESRGSFSFTMICLCALGLEIFCWSWISLELCRSLNLLWQLVEPGIPTSSSCSPDVSNTLLWVDSQRLILSWLFWHCSAFSFSFRDLKHTSLSMTNALVVQPVRSTLQSKCQPLHMSINPFHLPATWKPTFLRATFCKLLGEQSLQSDGQTFFFKPGIS